MAADLNVKKIIVFSCFVPFAWPLTPLEIPPCPPLLPSLFVRVLPGLVPMLGASWERAIGACLLSPGHIDACGRWLLVCDLKICKCSEWFRFTNCFMIFCPSRVHLVWINTSLSGCCVLIRSFGWQVAWVPMAVLFCMVCACIFCKLEIEMTYISFYKLATGTVITLDHLVMVLYWYSDREEVGITLSSSHEINFYEGNQTCILFFDVLSQRIPLWLKSAIGQPSVIIGIFRTPVNESGFTLKAFNAIHWILQMWTDGQSCVRPTGGWLD